METSLCIFYLVPVGMGQQRSFINVVLKSDFVRDFHEHSCQICFEYSGFVKCMLAILLNVFLK